MNIPQPGEPSSNSKGSEREYWAAMDKLVARQTRLGRFTEYPDPQSAKKHLI